MRRIRKLREITGSGITVVFCAAMLAAPEVRGQSAEEFQQLKAMVEQMRKTIDAQNARIADLEKKAGEPAPVPAAVTTPPATNLLQTIHATMAGTNQFGAKSPSIQFMERI